MFYIDTFSHVWSLIVIVFAVLCGILSPLCAIATEVQAISRGWLVPNSSTGFAEFRKDDSVFYHRGGGAGGGRGFNIAAMDARTGTLLQAVQNFDTWLTRSTGTAMNAMMTFLNGLPNGTVVLIAVGDEAGLNVDNSCSHLSFPWVEAGLQALESLGSTQLRNYCFRSSWSMISVKGASHPKGEQLGHAVEVAVQTTLAPLTPRDLNGDGKADLVWRQHDRVESDQDTGQVAGWFMNGLTLQQGAIIDVPIPLDWGIVGVGDLNGDGKADLVWQRFERTAPFHGGVAVWLMNGLTLQQGAIIAPAIGTGWIIAGVGDLNGDGKADLVWRNVHTGAVAGWLMNGLSLQEDAIIALGISHDDWNIVGVGDLNGDGKADLVWWNIQTGAVVGWLMHGLALQEGAIIAPAIDRHWGIVGVGDLNGDGKADLVWRHSQTGDVAGWLMHGLTLQEGAIIAPAIDRYWGIVGIVDLNGDGKADLVWRHSQTGDVAGWLMHGLALQEGAIIALGISLEWHIQ